jgi:hypothetical protein
VAGRATLPVLNISGVSPRARVSLTKLNECKHRERGNLTYVLMDSALVLPSILKKMEFLQIKADFDRLGGGTCTSSSRCVILGYRGL